MQPSVSPEPRTIVDACGGAFTERARRRGSHLFSSGHAALEGIGPEMALLSVQHDRDAPFRVVIDVGELENRDQLRVECQCAFFTAGHPCEHVYAALLALEAGGEAWRIMPPRVVDRRLDVVTYRTGLPLGEDAFFDGEHAFARFDAHAHPLGFRADWRSRLDTLKRSAVPAPEPTKGILEDVELVLDPTRSETAGAPVITVRARHPQEGRILPVALARRDLERIIDPSMREAVEPWLACPPLGQRTGADALAPDPGHLIADTRRVPTGLQRSLLGALSKKLRFGTNGPELVFDSKSPWQLQLQVSQTEGQLSVEGVFIRADDPPRTIEEANLVLRDGWIVFENRIFALDPGPSFDWVRHLRREGPIAADCSEAELFRALAELPALPHLRLDTSISDWVISTPKPIPSVAIGEVDARVRRAKTDVIFCYDNVRIGRNETVSAVVDSHEKRIILRDLMSERSWTRRILSSGIEPEPDTSLIIRSSSIADLELALVELGAEVEREGTRLRKAGRSHLRLSTNEDWFELEGQIDFEGTSVGLDSVLRAVRDRNNRISLPDGTEGILTSAEARRFRALAGLSSHKGGKLRFARSQAILLDALISSQPSVEQDPTFKSVVKSLRGDLIVGASPAPEGFSGTLRSYQQMGLGWLLVLRRMRLGGCLADDMGLGKTVQILALLLSTHREKEKDEPIRCSLVVAPRSLVFNWKQESARFAPELKVLEYTGQSRVSQLESLEKADVIFTTYGTLRRDIEVLAGLNFEYVILDEAQTIKNHAAQVSKACRALKARYRVALSGTPIENDVSELWSIFQFLNPGMLGSRADFVRMAQGDALNLVARGLSPLLLRRRKEDVLSELPEKTELTVYCDLSTDERKQYDNLRIQYRQEIDRKAAKAGNSALRTEVLEALLRLRQMACHPGLIDDEKKSKTSTKLETIVSHLQEVVAEGHKALVFSQFVKLLDIVRTRLDAESIRYAYLDGRVRDRASVVDRFQNDTSCPVFLISLRAGGLGLNLTAADYVFILDPWWNPAVEAQAIDRAHRIGQTRPVFAYRYIARNTVEEKILALHRDKRALAEAIMGGDSSQGGKLSLDELRLLLQ